MADTKKSAQEEAKERAAAAKAAEDAQAGTPDIEAEAKALAEAKAELEKIKAEAEQARAKAEAAKVEAEKAREEAEAAIKAAQEKKEDAPVNEAPHLDTFETADVYEVFCKIPAGMTFALPDGRKIKVEGAPVSSIMDSAGRRIPGSGYAKTPLAAGDWEYIKKTWGGMKCFNGPSPAIYARPFGKGGEAQARELAEAKSGFEQVDPTDKKSGIRTEKYKKD